MQKVEHEENLSSISAVERDTGLTKDTLRMWERRYGFPQPFRDAHGERAYPPEQIEKLRLLKRLLDRGFRPGKIIGLSSGELSDLGARAVTVEPPRQELEVFLRLIKSHQVAELRRHLSQTLARQGLQDFVLETVGPLNVSVGEAWMRGFLAVFEEHLYTEMMQSLLRNAIASLQSQGRAPRVLMTSLPNEQHSLGLLMLEALLAVEGAQCVNLGTETPAPEIAEAASAHRADIVALSFSAAYSETKAAEGLRELRGLLPPAALLCAGGAAVARIRKPIEGVELVPSLERMVDIVRQWRAERTAY